jgi:tetratricopeptide (TPR) repeat protein
MNSAPPRRRPTSAGAAPARARPAPSAGPAKLVATGGPAAGTEFPLDGDEVVIGRASENPISIPDTSVSRKHVLLRKTPEGWAASDMGSGNGTMVNGETIAAETPLKAGDTLTMGDTELRYETGGAAAARPSRGPPPKRGGGAEPAAPVNTSGRTRAVVRTSRRGAGEIQDEKSKKRKLFIRVAAVLIICLGGAVTFRVVKTRNEATAAAGKAASAAEQSELRKLKQEGVNLVREGKWKEAREKYTELQQRAPDFETQQITQLLAAADKEIPNQERMREAEDFIGKGEIASAHRTLEQVTPETAQYKQRDAIRAAMDRKIAEKINDARALLGATSDLAKMQELKALVEDILTAKPEHRDALAYKDTADQAIHRIKNPYVAPKTPEKPWLDVQARFQSGDLTGANAQADACAAKFPPCKVIKGQLQEFADKLKRAESASANELLALIELDKKIGGGSQSPMTKTVARKGADEFARKASSAKASGNWQPAIENARKALTLDSDHTGAKALLADARTQAKEVYLRAYQMKDSSPDDAIKLFKDVIAMTPKDDEYHQKAKSKIEELAK